MTQNTEATQAAPPLHKMMYLLSFIAAVTVSNMYLSQPLLAEIARYFNAPESSLGVVVMLAQIGYGLGVLLIVPLGDTLERRSLMLWLLAAVCISLLGAGFAPTVGTLAFASLCIGLTTIVPQIVVPYAASLAPAHQRATVIGVVQSGLLIGILLVRTVAGGIASVTGWRGPYFCSAALMLTVAYVVWSRFPRQTSRLTLTYRDALRSMWRLWTHEESLRRVSMVGALNFAVFSVFWTTLAFLLKASYGYGPGAVGLFGIVGVTGALAAGFGGKLSDLKGTAYAQRISLGVTLISYGSFWLSHHSLTFLILGVILMDAGVQAAHIACQAEAFSLDEAARSRLNGIYMFVRFAGGAVGSITGAWCWDRWGWSGVCACGTVFCLASYLPYVFSRSPRTAPAV